MQSSWSFWRHYFKSNERVCVCPFSPFRRCLLACFVVSLRIFVLCLQLNKMNVEETSNVTGDGTHGEGTSAQAQADAPANTTTGSAQGEASEASGSGGIVQSVIKWFR
jgi:hypothetical protein